MMVTAALTCDSEIPTALETINLKQVLMICCRLLVCSLVFEYIDITWNIFYIYIYIYGIYLWVYI